VTIIKGDVPGVAQPASDCSLGSVHALPGVQPNNVVLFEYHTSPSPFTLTALRGLERFP